MYLDTIYKVEHDITKRKLISTYAKLKKKLLNQEN